jgi:hypothetical protein
MPIIVAAIEIAAIISAIVALVFARSAARACRSAASEARSAAKAVRSAALEATRAISICSAKDDALRRFFLLIFFSEPLHDYPDVPTRREIAAGHQSVHLFGSQLLKARDNVVIEGCDMIRFAPSSLGSF